jgi:hypothetical protein
VRRHAQTRHRQCFVLRLFVRVRVSQWYVGAQMLSPTWCDEFRYVG